VIYDLFPTKVLIQDFEMSDKWNSDLEATINAVFASEMSTGKDFERLGDNSIPLFTIENMKNFPVLEELKLMFINGFYDLAKSFPNYEKNKELYKISKEDIEHRLLSETGRLPFMKSGDYKSVHDHESTLAFGVFYTHDVDNENDGGQLVLRDPSFNSNRSYSSPNKHFVETKKNRLVIGPGHLWHEVTPYRGRTDRTSIVLNLVY
jgi:hypothetical protein